MPAVLERGAFFTDNKQLQYLRTRREKGSRAFHLEYDTPPTRHEVARELTSYLAEYRLEIPRYSYELLFGRGQEGDHQLRLRSIDRGEPVGNKTKRVIEERTLWFEPTEREKAEDKAVEFLDKALQSVETGDTLVWGSPPGSKEQGYGDYGFLFVGRATKQLSGEAHLAMTAIRIENPKKDEFGEYAGDPWVSQYNQALSSLTGASITHITREQILGNPHIIRHDIALENIDEVIKQHFAFQFDAQAQANSEAIIAQMSPLITEATTIMLLGTKEQKRQTLHALENYALTLKAETAEREQGAYVIYREIRRPIGGIGGIIDRYGYEPPRANGSCGSSDATKSSKEGNVISSITGGECAKIRCGGHSCGWEADESEAKAVSSGDLTSCPECGWKP